MKSKTFRSQTASQLAIFVVTLVVAISASGQKATVLHSFRSGGSDGLAPYGDLISDAVGNLFGTTAFGGTSGAGIVFELTKPGAPAGWTETVLYNFTGMGDGSQPFGGLVFDSSGSLYGTTSDGGASGAGVVYQLTPPAKQGGSWTETVLYSFAGGADGAAALSDLAFDQAGNLYGTTSGGGAPGNGIVFELTPPTRQGDGWTETVLHRFLGHEGTSPRAAVIFDKKGAIYGTLANNGGFSAGAVFRLEPPATQGGAWTEKTIYRFRRPNGYGPLCSLILFKGSLYGTTVIGGASGVGTIFQLSPPASHYGAWTETILHSFTCNSDGCYPEGGLTMDKKGVFYGTTQYGGMPSNGGTVYQLKQDGGTWTESVLFSFTSNLNQFSATGLLLGGGGTLYGTTVGDTMDAGMVFKIRP